MKSKLFSMMFKFGVSALMILCYLCSPVSGVPPIPDYYYGQASIGGFPLADGIIIEAYGADGVLYGWDPDGIEAGSYVLSVSGDDPDIPQKNGCVNNEKIQFWTDDGKLGDQTSTWTEGGSTQLNLSFDNTQPVMLKINEIMVDPLSGNEWIEIYNPTSTTVSDLSEYRFFEFDSSDPTAPDYYDVSGSGTLAPGEFHVINITGTGADLLDNAGDAVILQFTGRGSGNEVAIDRVEWGLPSGNNPQYDDTSLSNAPIPTVGRSLALQPDGDENDDPANDFVIADTPTPGSSNGVDCGGADFEPDGDVDWADLAVVCQYWLESNCAALGDCGGADLEPRGQPDGDVDMKDFAIFAQYWFEFECHN